MIKITSSRVYISTSIRNVLEASLSGSNVYDRVLDDWFGRNIGKSISFALFLMHILLSWRHFFAKWKSFGWGQDMARLNLSATSQLFNLSTSTSLLYNCGTLCLCGRDLQVWGKVQNIFKPNTCRGPVLYSVHCTCTGNIKANACIVSSCLGKKCFCNVANLSM